MDNHQGMVWLRRGSGVAWTATTTACRLPTTASRDRCLLQARPPGLILWVVRARAGLRRQRCISRRHRHAVTRQASQMPTIRSSHLSLALCLLVLLLPSIVSGLHFYVQEGEKKCFIEDVPKHTVVVGGFAQITICHPPL